MYNDTVIDHFNNPRNTGELKDCSAVGQVTSEVCGDTAFVFLSVADGVIENMKCKTFGCAAAIASASMLSTMAIGKSLEEAKQLTGDVVVEALGGLPEAKLQGAALAADALQEAI